MPSTAETVLRALHAAVAERLPYGVEFLRGDPVPDRIPPAGVVVMHDGEPGEPEVLLSPLTYVYQHRAEFDVVIDRARAADPHLALDAIRVAIGAAIAVDRTLGGLCDEVRGVSPLAETFPVEGAPGLKAATITVVLTYAAADPLT